MDTQKNPISDTGKKREIGQKNEKVLDQRKIELKCFQKLPPIEQKRFENIMIIFRSNDSIEQFKLLLRAMDEMRKCGNPLVRACAQYTRAMVNKEGRDQAYAQVDRYIEQKKQLLYDQLSPLDNWLCESNTNLKDSGMLSEQQKAEIDLYHTCIAKAIGGDKYEQEKIFNDGEKIRKLVEYTKSAKYIMSIETLNTVD